MIFGCVSTSSHAVERLAERTFGPYSQTRIQFSIRDNVGLGCSYDATSTAGFSDEDTLIDAEGALVGTSLGRLRGQVALIGRRRQSLIAARGDFGGRPLYVAKCAGAVVVCSLMLPLLELQRGRLVVNDRYVAGFVAAGSIGAVSESPFLNVDVVPTAVTLTYDGGGGCVQSSNELIVGEEFRARPAELAVRLREELAASYSRATQGKRVVGVLASGGVDSSALLAIGVDRERHGRGARVLAVTSVHGGPGDDRPHMSALRDRLGVENIESFPSEGTEHSGRYRIVDGRIHMALPAESALVAVQRARDRGAEILVSGESSEWLLDASVSVLAHHVLALAPSEALSFFLRFQQIDTSTRRMLADVAAATVATRFPCGWRALRALRHRRAQPSSRWYGQRVRSMLARPPIRRRETPCSQAERVSRASTSAYLADAACYRARFEQTAGLRVVVPYLDPHFVDFAARLPTDSLFSGCRERGLLREALRGFVPETVRLRMTKSRPDDAYLEAYLSSGGYASIRGLADASELIATEFVLPAFRDEILRFASNPGSDWTDWYTLWPALAAEAFLRWVRDFNGPLLLGSTGRPPPAKC